MPGFLLFFNFFLHHFVLAKSPTRSVRVNFRTIKNCCALNFYSIRAISSIQVRLPPRSNVCLMVERLMLTIYEKTTLYTLKDVAFLLQYELCFFVYLVLYIIVVSDNDGGPVPTQQNVLDTKRTANGQQTDSKRTANRRPMFGQQTDINVHATVCALKHRTTVCCPFAVQSIGRMFDFFPVIIVRILLKCYFLDFH